ncbi:MAG: hypothetical protein M1380_03940 [Chloroflexi bacterium]|nr:hypothetical protein [Chloroflexota bacterium]
MIGDSKLITRSNILGFYRVGARFVGPTGLSEADRGGLFDLWQAGEAMHRLDEPVQKEGREEQGQSAGQYWGLERREELEDPETGKSYPLRRLFVQSLADRKAVRHQRAKELARARQALWTIRARLLRPAYRDRALVQRKASEAVAKVKGYVTVEIAEGTGGLDLHWRLDRERLRQDRQMDGIYCVLSNWKEATTQGVFRAYVSNGGKMALPQMLGMGPTLQWTTVGLYLIRGRACTLDDAGLYFFTAPSA